MACDNHQAKKWEEGEGGNVFKVLHEFLLF